MKSKAMRLGSVASTMSLILAAVSAGSAVAQDAGAGETEFEEITVTGIRGSLQRAMDIKRSNAGVVDAISAEDMGKFPDTNLAESLQRITGVSIDRVNGEGSKVTVRGFGPDFNLVTLNGRQMPVSTLEETTASSSRSFDFANLASEGIAGVEVFKTGRASIPTGGIGSTINIKTTRPLDAPGMKASIGAKALADTSEIDGTSYNPEFSGIYSNTFAEDKFGVAVSGSYQKRESGYAQASTPSGWRGAYLGSENNWGTLPQIPDGGTEEDINVINRPGPNDVYGVQQSLGYVFTSIDRERINGQATMQFRPVDTFTATVDYTYSKHKVKTNRNDVSVWFNFGDTSSEWTDGPVAGPVRYSEYFAGSKDVSMGGGKFEVNTEMNSIGLNLDWQATDRLHLELDVHDSSSLSDSGSPYGTSAVVSTAAFLSDFTQSIDYSRDFPVLSLDGVSGVSPAGLLTTGSSFRNSLMRTDIKQAQFNGSYDFDTDFIKSVDFGASYTENKVRSAFSNAQRDTWGGVGTAADIPDDIFVLQTISDKFSQVEGHDDPALFNEFYSFDFDRMVGLIDSLYDACGGDGVCIADDFTTDRRTEEKSWAGYVQVNSEFDIVDRPARLVAGMRYEKTDVDSRALVPIAVGTQWVANNEFGVIFSDDQDFTELTGSYEHWLPSIDFDVEFYDNMVFRASYSETFTRPGYNHIQGGQTVNQIFRVDGGDGSQGDPGLLPFSSKNIDLSTEWYYDDASYFSVGFFHKKVSNFIASSEIQATPFDLVTPYGGKRYNDAVAALGGSTDLTAIRNWIFANADPSTVEILGTDSSGNTIGNIFGVPGEDPTLTFDITVPINERSAKLHGWEFALQHTFGDTGFGAILNYTIVRGDVDFDITQPASVAQFALVGLSDSANIIGFYDKNGLQVRVAYNWRDKFLNSTSSAAGPNNPLFTEAYGQFDVSMSYDVTEALTVFAEAINLTNSYNRVHGRHVNEVNYLTQTGPRYAIGARYKF
ncbi:TonB-dependent receptor [Gimibacter soli]|uniref:TonB-dependent receptor n=1 Tax=Gimibacter soli TaxID=3024400 RepID=A0AAE9XXB2_9PROT|nr:TonB-dependent receptor [Gimibacter soli]WCL55314.1 TonB-dependent receptor [Gimibacter soli]